MKQKAVFSGFLFLALLGLFLLTAPANHTEAEDAYEYARQAEQGRGVELFHFHHLLYLPLMQGLFRLLQDAGYAGRAFPVLMGISMVCGALTICLFTSLLARRRGAVGALPFSLGLLFSYGFWRYACEAEIYIPAALFAVWAFWLASDSAKGPWRAIATAVTASLGILVHLLNVIPLAGGITLYYILRRRFKTAGAHLLLVTILVAAVYTGAALTVGFSYTHESQPQEGGLDPWMLPKGLVGAGQAVVSGNFLFAYPGVQQQLQRLFPYRMLGEELYMGRHAPLLSRAVPSVTLTALVVVGAWLLVGLVRRLSIRESRFAIFKSWGSDGWVAAFWLLGISGIVLLVEPGNPELWVLALMPLWWTLSACWPSLNRKLVLGWGVLVFLLALHNGAGGMALIRSRDGDYNYQKTKWLLSQELDGGLIITADNPVYIFYLHYHTDAGIIDLQHGPSVRKMMESIERARGPIYVFGDVFSPPEALKHRFPESAQRVEQCAEQLRSSVVKRHDNEFGGVYQLPSGLSGLP